MHGAKNRLPFLAAVLVSAAGYVMITYFTERTDHPQLFSIYIVLFLLYWWMVKKGSAGIPWRWMFSTAILFRILLLVALPNLSDDFYRFIWDGRLLAAGYNPFAALPGEMLERNIPGITEELYRQLNSPAYFTIYPPVNQFVFWLSALLGPTIRAEVVIMRLFILLAETATLLLLPRILKLLEQPVKNSWWYAFNPLVILELTGNLHFEALMICFMMFSFYWWLRLKETPAVAGLGLAIATKLNPLIFLPSFLKIMPLKKLARFYLLVLLITFLLFLPLASRELLRGISESVSLYFQRFEFNASMYYLVRAVGYIVKGYNIIGTAGKWLAISTFLGILIYSLLLDRKKPLPYHWLWIYFIYLLLATTVHPWYVTPLLAFTVFTRFRFPVLWSFLIFFTYMNYRAGGYLEDLRFVLVEYLAIFLLFGYELVKSMKFQQFKSIEP